MTNKKKEKEITFEILYSDLSKINGDEIDKISDVFCRYQKIKVCGDENKYLEELDKLFKYIIEKTGKMYWKVLFSIFSRLYNKGGKKYSFVLNLIKQYVSTKIVGIIDNKEFYEFVDRKDDIKKDDEYLNSIFSKIKLNEENTQENISIFLMYSYFSIKGRKPYDYVDKFNEVLRSLFSYFCKENKNDMYYLKEINKALTNNRLFEKFYGFVFLYQDMNKDLNELNSKYNNLLDINNDLLSKNNIYSDKINNNQILINSQKEKLKEDIDKINELNNLLKQSDDKNEYNKNLYEKKYLTLKRSMIDKIKKELNLDISGIEDIIEDLPDNQRNKIQRRIDNIYKSLLRMGE